MSGIEARVVTIPTTEKRLAILVIGLTQSAFAIAGAIATIGAAPAVVSRKEIVAA